MITALTVSVVQPRLHALRVFHHAATFVFVVLFLLGVGAAQAATTQRIALAGHGGTRLVPKGATSTLLTDLSYVDLVVGDPEIADVMPLTDRSFSVHGKKIGATTVSAYNAERKLIGQFDLEIGAQTGRLRAELRRRIRGAAIEVSSVNGRILLSGSAPDAVSIDTAMAIAKQFGGDVLNQMTVSQPQQVMLEVRFIEASRKAGRALGVKWDAVSQRLNAHVGSAGLMSGTPFGAVLGQLLSGGTKVDVLVEALEEKGLARRLAEPNLVAMSGQTASFLAGGEYPIPVAGMNGMVTVEFKKFGVGLSFTPTVLANGVINLKIEPEVSQIDRANSVTVNGLSVPGVVVRRLSTNVELKDGQSFALAGLLQSVTSENVQGLPWLNDVPVLGSLFRSSAFERNETDLAVLVTPRLVRPATPGQKLHTPLDTTVAANDVDLFLAGKLERTAGEARLAQGRSPRVLGAHILTTGGDDGAQN